MALLTLNDFIKINKENHDARAKERAEDLALQRQERAADNAIRAKERSEDFDKLSGIIENSVKSQVTSALKPVIERQESFENKTDERFSDFQNQLDTMLGNITSKPDNDPSDSVHHDPSRLEVLEEQLANLNRHIKAYPAVNQFPPLHPSSGPSAPVLPAPVPGLLPPPQSQKTPPYSEADLSTIKSIISHATTIVGLGPVTPADIDNLAPDDPAKGIRLAALDILRLDLNIKEDEISDTDIAATFTPAQFPKPPRVYVRFYKQEHVNLCLSVAKRLKNPEVKVCRYFPRQFIERYKALENEAYPLRYPRSIPGYKTEVVYTEDDIELLICPNGHFRYRPHPVHGLPPIDLAPVRSPPKGRHSKRGRSDTSSPELLRKTVRFNSPSKVDDPVGDTTEGNSADKKSTNPIVCKVVAELEQHQPAPAVERQQPAPAETGPVTSGQSLNLYA